MKGCVGRRRGGGVSGWVGEVWREGEGKYRNVEFGGYEFDEVGNDNVLVVV